MTAHLLSSLVVVGLAFVGGFLVGWDLTREKPPRATHPDRAGDDK